MKISTHLPKHEQKRKIHVNTNQLFKEVDSWGGRVAEKNKHTSYLHI